MLALAGVFGAHAQSAGGSEPHYRVRLDGLRILALSQLPLAESAGAVPAGLSLSASSLNFGYVGQGQSDTRQVQLQNTGGAPFPVSVNAVLDSDKFLATHNCPASLEAGTTCLISVEFLAGDTPGTWSAAVAVSAEGRSFKVPLSGTTAYPEATGRITTYANNLGALSSDYNFWAITPTAKPTFTGGDCHSPSNIAGCVEGPFYWMTTVGGPGYSMRVWGTPPVLYPLSETYSVRLSGTPSNLVVTNHATSTSTTFVTGVSAPVQGIVVDSYRDNTYYVLFRPTVAGHPVAARFSLQAGQVTNFEAVSVFDGATAIPSRSMTEGAAVSPDGNLYYRAGAGVYRIGLQSGIHEAVPSLAMPSGYSAGGVAMTNPLEASGIAFDGRGNALRLANAQVLKWPLLPDGTFGPAVPIAGRYNQQGSSDGVGTNALVQSSRTFLRQGPAGTAWLVQFLTASGEYSAIRQVK